MALRSNDDGFDDLRLIVRESMDWLTTNGALVLEMAPGQTASVAELAEQVGFDAEVYRDVAGLERAVVARRTET